MYSSWQDALRSLIDVHSADLQLKLFKSTKIQCSLEERFLFCQRYFIDVFSHICRLLAVKTLPISTFCLQKPFTWVNWFIFPLYFCNGRGTFIYVLQVDFHMDVSAENSRLGGLYTLQVLFFNPNRCELFLRGK